MKDEIRIASIGNVDSAKSTTISVLSTNILDNGRGKARTCILKHPHEELTGRTSSISHHYIENSEKIFGFIDLAGHEKYLKTTMSGLNGHYIDYGMVTIGVDRGIIGMAKEHMAIALSLKIPLFIVITKIDIAIQDKLDNIKTSINNIFKHPIAGKKKTIIVSDSNIEEVCNNFDKDCPYVPVFEISNVTGLGIDILKKFVFSLKKYKTIGNEHSDNPIFRIDDRYKIKGIGLVVSGIVQEGIIRLNDKLLIGPFNGKFKEVLIRSIHDNFKRNVDYLTTGQGGCFNIKVINKKENIEFRSIKQGHIITKKPKCFEMFDAKITILHHPTTIRTHYEPVIHCGSVRQSAKICKMDKELARTGDSAIVTFKFCFRPEFIENNMDIVFRDGRTKGIGKVLKTH
uniref:Tr-type G domain-containing protein n=1 Tax=viral metagenome TaxID=1070528 RepID=A0A6C0JF73_9ZZZZ